MASFRLSVPGTSARVTPSQADGRNVRQPAFRLSKSRAWDSLRRAVRAPRASRRRPGNTMLASVHGTTNPARLAARAALVACLVPLAHGQNNRRVTYSIDWHGPTVGQPANVSGTR